MRRLALSLLLVALVTVPASAQIISYAAPLPVVAGGTGGTTLTSNGVLYGAGAGAIVATAQGPANSVLTANAGAPIFSTNPTVTSVLFGAGISGNGGAIKDGGGAGLRMVSTLNPDSDANFSLGGSTLRFNTLNLSTQINLGTGGVLTFSGAVPTISSGFGTNPSVTGGTATAFRVNVGTGGTATSGVIAMNATATTGWNCFVEDQTTANINTRQTASNTTTVTFGTTVAWTASDILIAICAAF